MENKPSTVRSVVDAIIDLIGGTNAGIACVAIGQPLDTVKVKMQTFPDIYPNSWQCFKKTFLQDGIKGLYAGTVPSLAANVAENAALFCAYGVCQKAVLLVNGKPSVEDLNPFDNACAGTIAAIFSSLTLCPTELVKCRLQSVREAAMLAGDKNFKKIGPWKMTRQILKSEGVPGLFYGLTATFAREMPGYFFFFGGYESARIFLTPSGKSKSDLGAMQTIVCGAIGGMSFWISVFPADVLKSRVQITKSTEPFFTLARNIIRNEGVKALYNGLGPTLIRTAPASGALFLAYEYTKKGLGVVADKIL